MFKSLFALALFAPAFVPSTLWAANAPAPENDPACPAAIVNDAIDTGLLEVCLKNQGLILEVHGIVPENHIFVGTYRAPDDFFTNINLSLLASTKNIGDLLPTLHRHDFILVQGDFDPNIPTAQKHIRIKKLEVVKAWDGAKDLPAYERQVILPGDLESKTDFIGKVHAMVADGEIVVVEYKDAVVPVFVKEEFRGLTKNLARGDKIKIHYKIQKAPGSPTHLNLDGTNGPAVEVMTSVMAQNGKHVTYEGKLVLFPKSPQVLFNVFAMNVDIGDGVYLNHTLINFEDVNLFKAIRDKLQKEWNANPNTIRNDRNKLINDAIWVKVTGTVNMIDPGQANPQVVIADLKDLVLSKPPAVLK